MSVLHLKGISMLELNIFLYFKWIFWLLCELFVFLLLLYFWMESFCPLYLSVTIDILVASKSCQPCDNLLYLLSHSQRESCWLCPLKNLSSLLRMSSLSFIIFKRHWCCNSHIFGTKAQVQLKHLVMAAFYLGGHQYYASWLTGLMGHLSGPEPSVMLLVPPVLFLLC